MTTNALRAVRAGWEPPAELSREAWEAARALPDTHPLKAFAGFGCSFSGLWFTGYAGAEMSHINHDSVSGPRQITTRPVRACALSIKRDVPALSACLLAWLSFFDVDPVTAPTQPECIYADPPYAGTSGYAAVGAFDHARFWSYCQGWAARGVRVFVSEYACPVGADVAWEKLHRDRVRSSGGAQRVKLERLFRVHPASVARVA